MGLFGLGFKNEKKTTGYTRGKKQNNPFYMGGAVNKIKKRKYNMYKQMREMDGGKVLSYKEWEKAGMPAD
ncbi:MAG TPA: hypothetical protein ENJ92_00120 [Chloroflexi bacterium]|nr:hypothetical protein [Chloroflexota bacterium]